MKIRNVISVFDGMSCGQLALTRQGIEFDNYYASEIDKPAQVVSKANFGNTIYIGDVRNVNPDDYENVDLFIGGSPCQKFSFAGTMAGMVTKDEIEITTLEHYLELKAQNFEFEGQSYLFWEYMRILTGLKKKNPNIKFLLENVLMAKKWKKILTQAIGINPISINSELVSAQTRKRLYWTNIGSQKDGFFGDVHCKIKKPKDRKIFLKDVLEKEIDEKYFLSDNAIDKLLIWEKRQKDNGNGFKIEVRDENQKSATLTTGATKSTSTYINDDVRKVKQLNPSKESGKKQPFQQNRIYDINGLAPALCADKADIIILDDILRIPDGTKKGFIEVKPGEFFDSQYIESKTRRGRKMVDKSNCLMAGEPSFIRFTECKRLRKLTPTECERLQTVPDGYTAHVSDAQRYRMLGNGWTVEVIMHIFSYL